MSDENEEKAIDETSTNTGKRSYKSWFVLLAVWGGVAALIALNMN